MSVTADPNAIVPPAAFYNKDLRFDGNKAATAVKGFLKSVTDPKNAGSLAALVIAIADPTQAHLAFSQAPLALDLLTNIRDGFGAVNLKADTPGQAAWVLLSRTLSEAALWAVDKESSQLPLNWVVTPKQQQELLAIIRDTLTSSGMTLNPTFFTDFQQLAGVVEFRAKFEAWLTRSGVDTEVSKKIVQELKEQWPTDLRIEYEGRPTEYAQIKNSTTSEFSPAERYYAAWRSYRKQLIEHIRKPDALLQLSLEQMYIPLRGYYEPEDTKMKPRVVNVMHELMTWVNHANVNDSVRILSGDPGSGKSSVARMLAAQLAKQSHNVLFVPLDWLDPNTSIEDAVAEVIDPRGFRKEAGNPLSAQYKEDRLLIVFDGLDELSKQGDVGKLVAGGFLKQVVEWARVRNLSASQARTLILLSGRPLIVESLHSYFQRDDADKDNPTGQMLHLLPYLVSDRNNYRDDKLLLSLEGDQRRDWWQQYGRVTQTDYADMPAPLQRDNDTWTEVTAQPLLHYLIAGLYLKEGWTPKQFENINQVYRELFNQVLQGRHKRASDDARLPEPSSMRPTEDMTIARIPEQDLQRCLEEIALTAWHGGSSRIATLEKINARYENAGLLKTLGRYWKESASGIERTMLAFYVHRHDYLNTDNAFEFTHKSFGEYLTACRIVRLVEETMVGSEDDALIEWAKVCGPAELDADLLEFLRREVALKERVTVLSWQTRLCNLISHLLRQAMPMHSAELKISTYREMREQSQHAEQALLAALDACVIAVQTDSDKGNPKDWPVIAWPEPADGNGSVAAKNWFQQLCLSYDGGVHRLSLECLACLRLAETDLRGADLQRADLQGAQLQRADLQGAQLQRADLYGADLYGAQLQGAEVMQKQLDAAITDETTRASAPLQVRINSRPATSQTDLSLRFDDENASAPLDAPSLPTPGKSASSILKGFP